MVSLISEFPKEKLLKTSSQFKLFKIYKKLLPSEIQTKVLISFNQVQF